ncbi:MAG: transglutaminase domain-containing protein [Bacteroidales bacterium]|nr:transglutaminase domain-containing protein [Bacteroidales bacterium]
MRKKILPLIILSAFFCGCSPFYQMIKLAPSGGLKAISFSEAPLNPVYRFFYPDTLGNGYLRELRQGYKLDSLTGQASDEFEKIKLILDWTHQQWEHNGSNTPSSSDALTILKEAHGGKQFRCVEYGIVAAAALNSLDIRARVLGLKTRDVEKVKYSAGHVVAEVYSTKYKKWIFIDPQFNVLPVLNGLPLNGVEFQNAILNDRANLKLINLNGEVSADDCSYYIKWVAKYLFYFDASFDQRIDASGKYQAIEGKTKLTLVPKGEKEPRVFQRKSKIDYSHYTNSLNDFYQKPF